MRRLLPIGAVVSLLSLSLFALPNAVRAQFTYPEGHIQATAQPPYTHYVAVLTDGDPETATYAWSANLSCGSWGVDPNDPSKMNWWHGEPGAGPEPNSTGLQCTHTSQPTQHEGTIQVDISDTSGLITRCTYSGIQSGTGPACSPLRPTLVVRKAVSPRYSAHVGDALTWTIDVTNEAGPDGGVVAKNVKLFDTFSLDDFEVPAITTTTGTCSQGSTFIECELGDMAVGATVTITVTAVAKAGAVKQSGGEFLLNMNIATAESDGGNNGSDTIGALILPKCGSTYSGKDAAGKPATMKVKCGDEGNDKLKGSSKPEIIDGGGGSDDVFGLGGNDFLFGGEGKDLLDCGKGKDVGEGGPGRDKFTDCEKKTQ